MQVQQRQRVEVGDEAEIEVQRGIYIYVKEEAKASRIDACHVDACPVSSS